MRYLVGFVFVLALVASPLIVSAQDTEETTTAEPSAEEAAPSSEPAPEEPALQLKLDEAGVQLTPAPAYPPEFDELELRRKRARIGLIASAALVVVGWAFVGGGEAYNKRNPPPTTPSLTGLEDLNGYNIAGVTLAMAGFIGMITSGGIMAHRRRELRRLEDEYYGTPHRAQWDLAQSALVF